MRFSTASIASLAATTALVATSGVSASPVAAMANMTFESLPGTDISPRINPALIKRSGSSECKGLDFDIKLFHIKACTAGTDFRKFQFECSAFGVTLASADCDLTASDKCQSKFWFLAAPVVLNWYCKSSKLTVSGEYYPFWQTVAIPEFSTGLPC